MSEAHQVYVTVCCGIATVDESTLPEGLDVRVLDFDAMSGDPQTFDKELDSFDRAYLTRRHHTVLLELRDMLEDDDDSDDDDDEDGFDEDYDSDDDDDDDDQDDLVYDAGGRD